ncbi:ribosome-associated translation inhibitor RaiA [Erysipelotrichaceae bacterium OttesenSCG-928-M19]|nr:ribosome-associated translation inhibitor RaiA [Erysipelotrichaceae bacterium OttesenSCG-928-M19]
MKYSIKGKNIQVTEAIEDYIETRINSLDKFFVIDEETVAKILIRVYDSEQKIEATIPTKYGILRAEARDKDLYSAIDNVVEKLESQIRKQKTKIKGHRAKEKLGHAFNLEFLQELEVDKSEELVEEVVRTKELTPEAKDIDTAILEMEMLNHSFYIFRDMETENISVIYKRKDGGYGLIETN